MLEDGQGLETETAQRCRRNIGREEQLFCPAKALRSQQRDLAIEATKEGSARSVPLLWVLRKNAPQLSEAVKHGLALQMPGKRNAICLAVKGATSSR